MRFLFWLSIFLLLGFIVQAQQIPLYSQYQYNPFLYNPAKTGEKENLHAFVIYRKQWIDFQGAPETRALSLDGAIKDGKIGLGGLIYSDNTDMIERFGGNLYYSYVFKIREDHKIGLGISAGIQETRVNFSHVILDDPNEPIQGNIEKGLAFDGAAGINYWLKGFQIGFAVPQIVGTKIKYFNNENSLNYQLSRHYLLTTSYNIKVIKDFLYIEPNAMLRFAQGRTFQVDGGLIVKLKEIAWVSATYRYDYAVTVGAGLKIHDRVTLGYAYDLALNKLKSFSKGSHEVLVGIKFGKKEDKGLIETIKNLEQKQQEQTEQLERINADNEQLQQENENLKTTVESSKEEVENLKQQMDQTVRELKDSIGKTKEDIVEIQKEAPTPSEAKRKPQPKQEVKEEENEPAPAATSSDRYYIIVGAFKNKSNAKRTADLLVYQQPNAGIVYNKVLKNYYVYISQYDTYDEAKSDIERIKRETQYKDAWIYSTKD